MSYERENLVVKKKSTTLYEKSSPWDKHGKNLLAVHLFTYHVSIYEGHTTEATVKNLFDGQHVFFISLIESGKIVLEDPKGWLSTYEQILSNFRLNFTIIGNKCIGIDLVELCLYQNCSYVRNPIKRDNSCKFGHISTSFVHFE